MPDTPEAEAPLTILAFDFGLRRIGVAVGQSITRSASPLGVIGNDDEGPDYDAIKALIREWQPGQLVVGMPEHTDGSPSDMRSHVLTFIRGLADFDLPIKTVDERYTSIEAQAGLKSARQSGQRRRVTKTAIDSAAAALIAERYLEISQHES